MSVVNEYRVVNRDGCTLVYGDVPMVQMAALLQAGDEECGGSASLAMDLAKIAGASIAWGSPTSIKALSAALSRESARAGVSAVGARA